MRPAVAGVEHHHGRVADPDLDTTRLTHDTGFAPAFDVATAVVACRQPSLKEHTHA
ncbi:MAG TPA: hypothetical protein VIX84_21635 [Acidimicrobiales bacterium]